jgi:hypothetical protein
LVNSANRTARGTSWHKNSSRFPPTSTLIELMPVMLPPGLFMLVMSPIRTGSAPVLKMIGMVAVKLFKASAGAEASGAAMAATLLLTR